MILLPCVSLTDPWASLVVNGDKTLETRRGPILSGYTGPLVIHRTLGACVDASLWQWGLSVPTRPAGWPADDRGMALGIVYVEGTRKHDAAGMFPITDDERRRACYVNIEGRYLSELTRAAWFPAPVKATGKQSRFQIAVPRDHLPAWALPG